MPGEQFGADQFVEGVVAADILAECEEPIVRVEQP